MNTTYREGKKGLTNYQNFDGLFNRNNRHVHYIVMSVESSKSNNFAPGYREPNFEELIPCSEAMSRRVCDKRARSASL